MTPRPAVVQIRVTAAVSWSWTLQPDTEENVYSRGGTDSISFEKADSMRPVSRGCFWGLSLSPRVTCHPHYHEDTCPPRGGPCPTFRPESPRLSERSVAHRGPAALCPLRQFRYLEIKPQPNGRWRRSPAKPCRQRGSVPTLPGGLGTCDVQDRRGPASGSVPRSGRARTRVRGGSPPPDVFSSRC